MAYKETGELINFVLQECILDAHTCTRFHGTTCASNRTLGKKGHTCWWSRSCCSPTLPCPIDVRMFISWARGRCETAAPASAPSQAAINACRTHARTHATSRSLGVDGSDMSRDVAAFAYLLISPPRGGTPTHQVRVLLPRRARAHTHPQLAQTKARLAARGR